MILADSYEWAIITAPKCASTTLHNYFRGVIGVTVTDEHHNCPNPDDYSRIIAVYRDPHERFLSLWSHWVREMTVAMGFRPGDHWKRLLYRLDPRLFAEWLEQQARDEFYHWSMSRWYAPTRDGLAVPLGGRHKLQDTLHAAIYASTGRDPGPIELPHDNPSMQIKGTLSTDWVEKNWPEDCQAWEAINGAFA